MSDIFESGRNDFASEQVPHFCGVEISDECNNGVENLHEVHLNHKKFSIFIFI